LIHLRVIGTAPVIVDVQMVMRSLVVGVSKS
jgi:hypothetical protein